MLSFVPLLTALASTVYSGERLIKLVNETKWMNQNQIQQLVRDGTRFMDITFGGEIVPLSDPSISHKDFPTCLMPSTMLQVNDLTARIDKRRIKKNLLLLTSFRTRYYQSISGRNAAEWVYQRIRSITRGSSLKITVQRLLHQEWPQFSIRCRFSPTTIHGINQDPVILSAHLDSTAMFVPSIMPAPGADDDGSGVVTLLEVIRLLARRDDLNLIKPIDIIFYSAEEAGLLGSQDVVRYYQQQNVRTASILHIDMDGYIKPGCLPGIGLLTDNTDAGLTKYLKILVAKYTNLPIKETACGYACSDHYSWHIAGYPAAALFEGSFDEMNPHIHTASDTVQNIDFDHLSQFVKIALAYALHLADYSMED